MDDNKKNELAEQDLELSADDLSDVSGGYQYDPNLSEEEIQKIRQELMEIRRQQQEQYKPAYTPVPVKLH